MATIGQLRYKLMINGVAYNGVTDSQISENLVPLTGAGDKPLIKLGIQAPIGTIVTINNKDIMIGRSGVYELNSDIEVRSLYFKNYANLHNVIIDYVY